MGAEALARFAAARGEPAWLLDRRLAALARLGPLDPGDAEELRRALDEEPGRLLPVAPELAAEGVEALPLARAAAELGSQGLPAAADDPLALLVEAFWSGGAFVRVPRGVKASIPLHLSAGVKRFGRLEKLIVIVEDGASLELVEGCTELGGAAGKRWSSVDVRVGAGARLRWASVQAGPADAELRSLKRLRVARDGRVAWTEVSVLARAVSKSLVAELGEGAEADILCGGFAGAGERQAVAVSARPPARAGVRLLAAGAVQAEGGAVERWGGQGKDSLQAFFEPAARRLPLEFSVELARLLDAAR